MFYLNGIHWVANNFNKYIAFFYPCFKNQAKNSNSIDFDFINL